MGLSEVRCFAVVPMLLGLALTLTADAQKPVARQLPAARQQAAQRAAQQAQIQRALQIQRRRAARQINPTTALTVLTRVGVGITKDKAGEVVGVSFPSNVSYSYLRYAAGFKKLQTLDLSGCTSMYDAGLTYIKDVKSLRVLKLSQCRNITDTGLASLAGLTNLTHLDLSYCSQISDVGLAKLKGLTKLKELNLSFCTNVADGTLKQAATAWKDLEVLNVGRCRGIGTAGWKELAKCARLRELSVESTSISDIDLKAVAAMPRLESLSLHYCRSITATGLNHLAAGKAKIATLSLAYNRNIKDADLAVLSGMPSLTSLNLRSTPLTDAGIPQLAKLPKLRSLDLSYLAISDAGIAALAKLKTLDDLTFNYGRFTDKGLETIAGMTQLKRLDLSYCRHITGAGMKSLGRLKNLERLALRSTPVNVRTLEAIKGHKKLTELDLATCASLASTSLKPVAEITSLRSLNLANNSWVSTTGLRSLKPLSNLRELDLSSCSRVTSLGIKYVSELTNLETLRISHCRSLTSTGVSALQKLTKLKELDVNGVLISSSDYSKLRRSLPSAKVTGQPTYTYTSSRVPTYSFVSAKVIIRGELDNAKKRALMEQLKGLIDPDTLSFHSVADVSGGTQFELAPIEKLEEFQEFAAKIKFGTTKVDETARTITVELPKRPVKAISK